MIRKTASDAPSIFLAELEAAFLQQRPPAFHLGHAANWATAIDYFLCRGRLDIAEHGVRNFYAENPTVFFARGVSAIFDNLPPVDPTRPAFHDDLSKDLQIAARPGAETVIVCFCGGIHQLGMPVVVEHHWHSRLDASLIYLRDFRQLRYLGGVPSLGADREETIAALRDLVASLGGRRIACYGTSSGVFPALLYGLELGSEAVLCMSGPTNLSPEFNPHAPLRAQTAKVRRQFPHVALDIGQVYRAAATPPAVRIYYGQFNWNDRLQAEHIGSLPRVTLAPVNDFEEHNVVLELVRRGEFAAALDWLMQPGGVEQPPAESHGLGLGAGLKAVVS
jgi:hypothetical protein